MDPNEWIARYATAWREKDDAGVTELFTEDAVYRSSPNDRVTLPGCLLLLFAEDGRCRELREYYNPVLGEAIPAPPGWGS
jgi:ketosteroid isomerase-like protein